MNDKERFDAMCRRNLSLNQLSVWNRNVASCQNQEWQTLGTKDCMKMNNKNKWTVEYVMGELHVDHNNVAYIIATAHNAVLAAEQEKSRLRLLDCCQKNTDLAIALDDFEKQLAAEQEKAERYRLDTLKKDGQLVAELEKRQGALHHMEACRALLNVPDYEVLYQAIKELMEK